MFEVEIVSLTPKDPKEPKDKVLVNANTFELILHD